MIDNVAIQIEIDNRILSYAQKRTVIPINDTSRDINVPFLPFLIEVENPTYEFVIGEKAPVPTVKITIWDSKREIAKTNEELNYEEIAITLFCLNKNNEVEYTIKAYMTDHSYSDSKLSFTVRLDEEAFEEAYSSYFRFDTFQSFDIFSPRDIILEPSMTLENDSPWSVFRSVHKGSVIAAQNGLRYGITTAARSPLGGVPGGGNVGVIRLANTPDKLGGNPIYIDYEVGLAAMFRVNVLLPTTNYSIRYNGTTFSYLSTPSPTRYEVLSSLAADINTAFPSVPEIATAYEELEVLYIRNSPSLIDETVGSIANGDIQFYFDPATLGPSNAIFKVEKPMFEAPMTEETPSQYYVGIIGDPINHTKIERFAYLFLTKGRYWSAYLGPGGAWVNSLDDYWYLSGIPTVDYNDPLSWVSGGSLNFTEIQWFDDTIVDSSSLFNKYSIENFHAKGEDIRDINALDQLYINTNGLTPSSLFDPQLFTGFVTLLTSFVNPINSVNYYQYFKYSIANAFGNVLDDESDNLTSVPEVMLVDINPVDPNIMPASIYHYPFVAARFWLPSTLEPATPAKLVNFEFVVAGIDVNISNLPDNVYRRLADRYSHFEGERKIGRSDSDISDRWRGLRFDMVNNIFDFRVAAGANLIIEGQPVQEDFSLENARLVNNANGKFAVCTGSDVIIRYIGPEVDDYDIFERLNFYIIPNENSWTRLHIEQIDDSPDADFNTDAAAAASRKLVSDSPLAMNYINYLTYKPNQRNIQRSLSDYDSFLNEAKSFFMSSSYRVINNPVPENSQDLGKILPIVYGNVYDVPLIHIISKKVMSQAAISAGDDGYIFASHPVAINTPADIRLTIVDRDNENTVSDKELFSNNLKNDLIEKPFPNSVEGHYVVEGELVPTLRSVQYPLPFPYHGLKTFTSNQNERFYGIELQGAHWDSRAGKLDKRYPIRNGLGSSKLYGSFSGWLDTSGSITGRAGSLIEHPLDIIAHMLTYYSRSQEAATSLDLVNIKDIKSITRDYRASIYLTEELNIGDLISDLCMQFGIVYSFYNGKLLFSILDDTDPNEEKVISDDFNLIHGIKEISNTYKDIYSEINYQYSYSYFSDSYASAVRLDQTNNQFCAKAARNRGPSKPFDIEAKYVRWLNNASEVARRYARFLARRRFEYELTVRPQAHQTFVPGDCLPLYSKDLDIQGSPVIVSSVQEGRDTVKLKVLHYIG